MIGQVNILVCGPDRPYFKQKQKNNITKFWQIDFFKLLFCFFVFNKRNKTTNLYQ